ncbi:MAG: 50S ribosomal protein L13 [Thermoplasmata archaeon]|nr:50S ribosomal protein L13 [Candidatus Thermoplasmatota archaeon]MCK4949062.1 50S ribosomal protein L13 [Thermoplasmata archaeon]
MAVIDATGSVLGRLASVIAKRLLEGEEIVVVNAELAVISGDRVSVLNEYKEIRDIGSQTSGPFFPRMPDKIVTRTIRGMIPYQKPRGREAFKRLRVYIGVPDSYAESTLERIEEALGKLTCQYTKVGDLSRKLGAKF